MSKKISVKTTATKKAVKPWQLPLVLDANAQKQLIVVQKLTMEKTATKAIIKSMYQAEYYMKRFQEETERSEALQNELNIYKSAVSSFTRVLKVMNELNSSKSVTNSKTENKGKKGLQLLIDTED